MATGIFSTTRVAGEGIALAIVGAMLAGFVGQGIAKITPNSDSASASVAIQRLAIGDLHQTQRVLPQASAQQLTEIYAGALHHLLLWLAALTLISAVIVYVALCLKKHIAPQPVNEALYQQDQ